MSTPSISSSKISQGEYMNPKEAIKDCKNSKLSVEEISRRIKAGAVQRHVGLRKGGRVLKGLEGTDYENPATRLQIRDILNASFKARKGSPGTADHLVKVVQHTLKPEQGSGISPQVAEQVVKKALSRSEGKKFSRELEESRLTSGEALQNDARSRAQKNAANGSRLHRLKITWHNIRYGRDSKKAGAESRELRHAQRKMYTERQTDAGRSFAVEQIEIMGGDPSKMGINHRKANLEAAKNAVQFKINEISQLAEQEQSNSKVNLKKQNLNNALFWIKQSIEQRRNAKLLPTDTTLKGAKEGLAALQLEGSHGKKLKNFIKKEMKRPIDNNSSQADFYGLLPPPPPPKFSLETSKVSQGPYLKYQETTPQSQYDTAQSHPAVRENGSNMRSSQRESEQRENCSLDKRSLRNQYGIPFSSTNRNSSIDSNRNGAVKSRENPPKTSIKRRVVPGDDQNTNGHVASKESFYPDFRGFKFSDKLNQVRKTQSLQQSPNISPLSPTFEATTEAPTFENQNLI